MKTLNLTGKYFSFDISSRNIYPTVRTFTTAAVTVMEVSYTKKTVVSIQESYDTLESVCDQKLQLQLQLHELKS